MSQRTRLNDDRGPVYGSGARHSFGCVLLIVGSLIVYLGWRSAVTFEDPQRIRLVLAGFLLLCLSPTIFTIVQVVRVRRAIGKAVLEIPWEYLPMGFHGSITYIRPMRGDARLEGVTGRLQCEEVLVTGSGKNKKTRRKVVFDEPMTPTYGPGLQEMRIQIPLRIPPAGPCSLDYSDANIRWLVRLELTLSGCPNTASSFELNVAPAVAN